MNAIDKYVLWEWFKVFLMSLVGILVFITLGVLYDDLGHLIEFGASFQQIFWLHLIFIPSLLPIAVPVALLISLLFVLGNFHRNNELVAMRAAGLSLFQVTRSLWIASVILTLGLVYLNTHLIPWSMEESKEVDRLIREKTESESRRKGGIFWEVVFENKADNRLWVISKLNEHDFSMTGMSIYERNQEGREVRRLFANSAQYDKESRIWQLNDGMELLFSQAADSKTDFEVYHFDQREFPEFKEDPQVIVNISKKPRHLSLRQIGGILQSAKGEGAPSVAKFSVRYHKMLAAPIICLIVAGLGIAFATRGVRVSPLINVSKAILCFFVYYVLNSFATIMGEQLILGPIVAAWSPNILMLAAVVYFNTKR